ncbi:MAG TPA: bifunctional 5,10-methylenetetrahydrofolate dehydrogenase/5,10-methenyltetrahydrofolate cyclohydrolase [Alphaproteobacteria bacterium]|nr:bifunctional 5,10-methylenetetrahydrofolate dehydrogenase/5,10-methenyltetrahydrofolate cyclohydrolase [Alphaproteobacteria bacterium]
MGHLLLGKPVSDRIRAEVQAEIARLARQAPYPPGLAVILVGDDPASKIYVRNKQRACEKVGIRSMSHLLPSATDEKTLLDRIEQLNDDPYVHGILVQLPLPSPEHEATAIESITPLKDVDGFHPLNVAKLYDGRPYLVPSTPAGILELLATHRVPIADQRVVIVGASNIVGKPLALCLLHHNAVVTLCHKYTRDLASLTREADILITAVGKQKLITADMVKSGAIVIDVGISLVEGKAVGDVDFEPVARKAALVTPVPGGVGPLTIAMLLANTLKAYKTILGLEPA